MKICFNVIIRVGMRLLKRRKRDVCHAILDLSAPCLCAAPERNNSPQRPVEFATAGVTRPATAAYDFATNLYLSATHDILAKVPHTVLHLDSQLICKPIELPDL